MQMSAKIYKSILLLIVAKKLKFWKKFLPIIIIMSINFAHIDFVICR